MTAAPEEETPRGHLKCIGALAFLLLSPLAACSGDGAAVDPAEIADVPSDAPVGTDAGVLDAGVVDAGADVGGAVDVGGAAGLCSSAADCGGKTPRCDSEAGACVSCLLDQHCPTGEVCVAMQCGAALACISDKTCGAIDAVCDADAGVCVDCLKGADCKKGYACQSHHCLPDAEPCGSSKDCADLGQVCSETLGHCVDCNSDADCVATDHCAAGQCLKDLCAVGDAKCADPATLSTCADNGSGWQDKACADGDACDDGACLPVVCKPGTKLCVANVVQICSARGTGLGDDVACKSTEVCKDGACLPKVCQPSETKCAQGAVETCAADGLSWATTACKLSQSCVTAANGGAASCKDWVCTPNADTCLGEQVAACAKDGMSAVATKNCAKLAAGAAGTCVVGACVPQSCKEDDKACANQSVITCKAAKWVASACPDKNTCTAGTCVPVSCVPKENYCDLTVLKTCNTAGDGASSVADCVDSGQGCKGGKCVDLLCQPGASVCNEASSVAKTCKGDGLGWVQIPCGEGQICIAGACKKKICEPSSTYCKIADVMSCDASGTLAVKLKTCVTGTGCLKGACVKTTCSPGQTRCGTGDAAGKLQTCAADQLSWVDSACPEASVCVVGVCTKTVCTPAAKGCVGQLTATCNGAGTAWTTAKDCAATKQVCVKGACQALACTPGEALCLDYKLSVCDSKGVGWTVKECTDNDACTKDFCTKGKCESGAPKICDDGNPCTNDVCNKSTAKCEGLDNAAGCDDGSACTVGDHCEAGLCLAQVGGTVSTWAGSGSNKHADGAWDIAGLVDVWGITPDGDGGLYLADRGAHRIRHVSANRQVSTAAGSGQEEYSGGQALSAAFRGPRDVAWHAASDSLYIADTGNHCIRRLHQGQVTLVAGQCGNKKDSYGYSEGLATAARFYFPASIAVAGDGSVVVADGPNHVIRRIVGNKVSLVAGTPKVAGHLDGKGSLARFSNPSGVAVSPAGAIYVADTSNHRIRAVQPDGTVSTIAGSKSGYLDGFKAQARFSTPTGLAWAGDEHFLVADLGNHRIRRLSLDGVVTSVAGSGIDGFLNGVATKARFHGPRDIFVAVDGSAYVADASNRRIRKITPATKTCSDGKPCTLDSCDPQTAACTNTPVKVGKPCTDGDACTLGELCDSKGNCGGSKAKSCDDGKDCTEDRCNTASGGCMNPVHDGDCSDGDSCTLGEACKNGICTSGLGLIRTIAGAGNPGFADGKVDVAEFSWPSDVSVDDQGRVWVADGGNHRIRRIEIDGKVVTVAGSGQAGFTNGAGSEARLSYPRAIAATQGGVAFFCDGNNHAVRRISAGAFVSTVAGGGKSGFSNGKGAQAKFSHPWGIAVSTQGFIYVSDYNNHRVRVITPAGAVSTLAGSSTHGHADGMGAAAKFYGPRDLALDAAGNVYIADGLNYRIRKVTSAGLVTTVAGSGLKGGDDGAAGSATFDGLYGLAVAGDGRLLVTDFYKLRQVHKGVVSTLIAGTGQPIDGGLHVANLMQYLFGIDIDLQGRIWLAASSANLIRRVELGTLICDDGSECTIDACDPQKGGCQHLPSNVGQACEDNDACTANTKCDGQGGCVGQMKNCGDGNSCTSDGCDPFLGNCTNDHNYLPCDDSSACTVGETCHLGSCGAAWMKLETLAGSGVPKFADGKGLGASFYYPGGVVWVGDEVWLADRGNNRVRRVKSDGTTTTVAGSSYGYVDGPGQTARFYSPADLALAQDGSVLVVDYGNRRVRRIDPEGVVSTFAGSGIKWSAANGPKAQAGFTSPDGIAVDAAGNVYVSEGSSGRIRKIGVDGIVSTLVGSAGSGYLDGPVAKAKFHNPRGLGVDVAGGLYVADSDYGRIRLIDAKGMVSTVAGDGDKEFKVGPAASSSLLPVYDVAVASGGELWVAGHGSNRVLRIAGGKVTVAFGDGSDGHLDGFGADSQLRGPASIAAHPNGHIAIADRDDHRIRIMRAHNKDCDDNKVCTMDSCDSKSGCLHKALAAGSSCDDNNSCTSGTKCDANGLCAGQKKTCSDGNSCTDDVCDALDGSCSNPAHTKPCDDGDACTVDETCSAGKCQNTLGMVLTLAGSTKGYHNGPAASARFDRPVDVAADPAGNVYVADKANSQVRKIDGQGNVTTLAGGDTPGFFNGKGVSARFDQPSGITTGASGKLVVWDQGNYRFRSVGFDGMVSTFSGSGSSGYQDGDGSVAKFYGPGGLAVDGTGKLYFADGASNRIRVIDKAGKASTLAGSGTKGYADGPANLAAFYRPLGVAVAPDGAVYVADTINKRIRRVFEGLVTTVAGSGLGEVIDGPAKTAAFVYPTELVFTPQGQLIISDRSAVRLRMLFGGEVSTLAGTGKYGSNEAMGKAASFYQPAGLAIGPKGHVYVADEGTHLIRTVLNPRKFCADDKLCTLDLCDKLSGKCSNPHAPDDSACAGDGKPCIVAMTCKSGLCQGGKTKPCDDGDACSADSCDVKTGACKHGPAAGCKAWHRVFVTGGTFSGNLGGLVGADAKCAAAATAAKLGGQWQAWLSTSGTWPVTRLPMVGAGYRRLDGGVIAESWSDLTDGTLGAGIDVTEKGAKLTAASGDSNSYCGGAVKPKVHTGTTFEGKQMSASTNPQCKSWATESSSSSYATYSGIAGATDKQWTQACLTDRCSGSFKGHLYCFDKTVTFGK